MWSRLSILSALWRRKQNQFHSLFQVFFNPCVLSDQLVVRFFPVIMAERKWSGQLIGHFTRNSLLSKTNISGTVTALSVSLTIGLASLLGLKSKLVSGNLTKTFAYWINYCVFPSLVLIIEARIESSTSFIKISTLNPMFCDHLGKLHRSKRNNPGQPAWSFAVSLRNFIFAILDLHSFRDPRL